MLHYKEMESAFGLFYLESGIMPLIDTMPTKFLKHSKEIAPSIYRKLLKRGALLYGN